ncbi:MAG: S1C family serine protease [Anaerolineaceae bacterium]|nr:S1C family serine protease [Anaerolineaceae bacterium]
MTIKHYRPLLLFACLLMVVSLACNLPFVGEVSIQKPTGKGTKAVTTLTDVHKAVIQIEAQGTFLDPEVGLEVNAAGRGSGFIIDSSGIAVTNNHVVTGAALVKVWVDGETEPRNAQVLGYSECNDLAVIKIDGSDFSYLDWYDGEISTGMEIYLAGFPLGEPEFSLTKGIVSKEHTSGDTSWTAVSGGVIAHDATSNPGNSGGPLVDTNGKVVGVNFASRSDANQYFAIPAATGKTIVAELEKENNFESIGVNGTMVSNEDGSITGVWVSSVASGSPADKTGLKPGDIITQMEGLVVGTDGTMGDYCSIIRTHDEKSTLSLTVLRWPTGEVLEGQINGRELEVVGSVNTSSSSSGSTTNNSGSSGSSSDSLDGFDYFVFGSKPNDNELKIFMQDGKLHFQISGDFWPYLYYSEKSYSDVMVTTVVENTTRAQRTKLVCRLDPGNSWYEFWISADGYYQIDYWNGGVTNLTDFESSSVIFTGATDTYAAECDGNELTLYIDNQKIASVSDSHLSSGYAGVGISADGNIDAVFDSFEIATP